MLLMAHTPQGEGPIFGPSHSLVYPSGFGYAARPSAGQKRPCDMDSLKMAISQAIPGTGQVKRAITDATFQPRAPAFTSLIQTCAKFRQVQKAIEIFDTMATSEAINVKPNTVHYRCSLKFALLHRHCSILCSNAEACSAMFLLVRTWLPEVSICLTALQCTDFGLRNSRKMAGSFRCLREHEAGSVHRSELHSQYHHVLFPNQCMCSGKQIRQSSASLRRDAGGGVTARSHHV